MSAEMVFRIAGLIGSFIVCVSFVASFPSKFLDLTGWQAVGAMGLLMAVMAQILSFGAAK